MTPSIRRYVVTHDPPRGFSSFSLITDDHPPSAAPIQGHTVLFLGGELGVARDLSSPVWEIPLPLGYSSKDFLGSY